jgi:hypothetical protein
MAKGPSMFTKAATTAAKVGRLFNVVLTGIFLSTELAVRFADGITSFLRTVKGQEKKAILALLGSGRPTLANIAKGMARNPTIARAGFYSAAGMVAYIGGESLVKMVNGMLTDPEVSQEARDAFLEQVRSQKDELVADATKLSPKDAAMLLQMYDDIGDPVDPAMGPMPDSIAQAYLPGSPITVENAIEIRKHASNLAALLATNRRNLPVILEEIEFCLRNRSAIERLQALGALED